MATPLNDASRVKIAVCGEVRSGKTSLLRAVTRSAALPKFNVDGKMPLIQLSLDAPEAGLTYNTAAKKNIPVSDWSDIPTDGSVVRIIVAKTDSTLGACDIIEFPALRDGHVTPEEIAKIAACDALVWMTIGSQAWRLSEKTILDKIPGRDKARSILVVSRADKFRTAADQDKLSGRLTSETNGYFEKGAMMRAAPDVLDQAATDDVAWEQIGGDEIATMLSNIVAKITPKRPVAEVRRGNAEPDALEDALSQYAPRTDSKRTRRTKKYWRSQGNQLAASRDQDSLEPAPEVEAEVVAAEPDPIVEPAEPAVAVNETVQAAPEATPTPEPAQEPEPVECAEPAPVQERAVVEPAPISADDNLMKEIADDVDGLLALAFVDLAAADKPDVISGDPEIAQTFAAQFADAATNILTTDVYENPEWVHLSLSDHQVLFGPADTKNTVVLMVCRSKNPGLARHAFLRLLTTTERVAA